MALRNGYAPDYLSTVTAFGDPTLRAVAGLPTVYGMADVQQGAAPSDVVAQVNKTNAVFQSVAAIGSDIPKTVSDAVATGGSIANAVSGIVGGSDAESGDCSNVSWSNPLDMLLCILNRSLFGVLAIVLIGLGAYALFIKD